jgi:hypothetical protein
MEFPGDEAGTCTAEAVEDEPETDGSPTEAGGDAFEPGILAVEAAI